MCTYRWVWLPLLLATTACGDDGDSSTSSDPTGLTSATGSASSGGDTDPVATTADPTTEGTTTGDDPTTSSPPPETTAVDSSSDDSESQGTDPGGGTIDVTLSGCDIDFGGTVVVTYNGSLGVASIYDDGATLSGSFQFELDGTGTMQLSTQHRIDTGNVINMVEVAQGTWTNLDSDALTGEPDSIGGQLVVNTWDPANGVADLQLDGVSLLNVVNGNVCTINGTIVTDELYP
ncbi:MAG: hypothetical protein AAF799_47740 [Myxococcota bacterium]